MKILCECNGTDCDLTIDIPIEKINRIKENPNAVVISDNCPTGPDPTDVLLSREEGYSIYRDNGSTI